MKPGKSTGRVSRIIMKAERIRVLTGPMQGTEMYITGSLSIGRSPENKLQLNDLQVSRMHAVIQQTPAGTVIRDLGSGNGTYIGDRRIVEYRLAQGDIIHIGPMQLQYETVDEARPGTSMPEESVMFRSGDESLVRASSAANVYQTFVSAAQKAVTADQLRKAQTRLAAVYEANQIISSERDLRKLFERVMDQIFSLIPAHNGVILLKDEETGELVTEFVKTGSGQSQVVISSTIVRRAHSNNEAVITYNAPDDARFGAGVSIIAQNITSAMCAPLRWQDQTLGVIYVDTRGTRNAFTEEDLQMLVALAGPAGIAIKNAQYLAELQQSYQEMLVTVANTIEGRDHYTVGHTWRVTNFAKETARVLGWPDDKLKECEMGGVLHDIGKIGIDDAILRKPGRLDDAEYAQMKAHPERGARMLKDSRFLVRLIPYALYHHERYDGKGYPYGLAGDAVPIEGRLIAVADTFDAMTSNRPYRKGMDPEIAIQELEKGKGSQFDPQIVEAFIHCYREGEIGRIMQEYHKGSRSISCPFCSTYIRIPDEAEVGGEFECGVCHRRVRLLKEGESFLGEVIAGTEPPHLPAPPPVHEPMPS